MGPIWVPRKKVFVCNKTESADEVHLSLYILCYIFDVFLIQFHELLLFLKSIKNL